MEALGQQFARVSPDELLVFLQGNLGAGKTTLVRGFLRGLDYTGLVKSPTYTLVEPYQLSDRMVYHFDLYRINQPTELEEFGLRDYFSHRAIHLLEWPEKFKQDLPTPDLTLQIEQINDSTRTVHITATTEIGSQILSKISALSH